MRLKDLKWTKEEIMAMAHQYLIEINDRLEMIVDRADGMYLYDETGEAYLDFYGGVAVSNVGNVNQKVIASMTKQAKDVLHTFNYPYTIPQVLLAKFISEQTGMEKVYFINSGAEAVEAMLKLARKYGIENVHPDCYEIVTATRGFHGRTFGAMTATGSPDSPIQKNFGPLLPGFRYARFNDLEDFKKACNDNTIAILIETIQGQGGVHVADVEFVRGLREFCDEKGMLLLIDEIQTGWGRTGKIMSYEHYGVKPDIVTMAKGMGGGLPIGAIATTSEIAKTFTKGSHGSTFGGGPMACAGALAACVAIVDEKMADNAARMGALMKEQLKSLPGDPQVRGKGLLLAAQWKKPIADRLVKEALKRKVMCAKMGDDAIRFAPPLIINEQQIEVGIQALRESLIAMSEEGLI